MTRLVHRPITVTLQDDQPNTFTDEGFTHTIETIVDRWQEAGKWWENEPYHHLYRVVTTEAYMFDIERVGEEWFIYRVWD